MSLNKFKKALEKKDITVGLPPIEKWLAFDNLAMNWVCTGSFRRAIPHRRSILIGGESGATKTMNLLQLAKKAQDGGYHVVLLDSETSISDQDLAMNKVNTDPEMFTPIAVTTHEETLEIITEALKSFDDDEKIFFILDSITGLMTESEDDNFDKGKTTNDMGRIVQANKKFLKMIGNRIRHKDWFFITSCHIYQNQDLLNGKGKYIFSNVGSALYYPSLSLQLTKLDLKDGQEQVGIRVDVTTKKNRFFKLGQKIRLNLPYDQGGFDPYDGVLDILKDHGYIDQAGAWYSFNRVDADTGEVLDTIKFQSKNFDQYAEELIDRYEREHASVMDIEMDDDEASVVASKTEVM
jgi:RecA/RadA recombinase